MARKKRGFKGQRQARMLIDETGGLRGALYAIAWEASEMLPMAGRKIYKMLTNVGDSVGRVERTEMEMVASEAGRRESSENDHITAEDAQAVAKSLVMLAKEMTAEMEGMPEDESETKKDFRKVLRGLVALRDKFAPTSEAGIFLGIVSDMAVHIRRGNAARVKTLAKEMMQEFGS